MRELSSKQQCYSFLDRGQGRWRRGQIRSGKYWVLSQREGKGFKVLLASLAPIRRSPQRHLRRICVKHQTKRPSNEEDLPVNAKMQKAWLVGRVWVLDDTSCQRFQCILAPCLAQEGSLPGEAFVLPMVKHGKQRILHRFLTGTRLLKHSAYVSPG